jgi:hypothetical protein
MLQLNQRVSATQSDASMTEPYSMNTLSPEVILSTLSKSKIPMTVESIAESTGHMRHLIFPFLKTLESSGQIIRLTDDGPAQFKVAHNVPGEFQMTPSPSAPAAAATKKPQTKAASTKAASAKVVSIKKSEKTTATKPAATPAAPKPAVAATPADARLRLLQAMNLSAKSHDDLSTLVEDFEGVMKGLVDEGLVESDNIFNEYVYMLTAKARANFPAEVLAQAPPAAPAAAPAKAAKAEKAEKATKKPAAKPAGKNAKAAAAAELPKRRRGRPTREEAALRAEEAKRLGLETPATAGQTVAAEPKAPAKKKPAAPKATAPQVAPVAAAPAPAPVKAPQASAPATVLPADLTENGEMLLQLNRVLSKLVDDQVGNLRQQNEMRKAEALEIAKSLKDLSINLTQVGKNMLEISERLLKSVS